LEKKKNKLNSIKNKTEASHYAIIKKIKLQSAIFCPWFLLFFGPCIEKPLIQIARKSYGFRHRSVCKAAYNRVLYIDAIARKYKNLR